MKFLTNAFSLQMIDLTTTFSVTGAPIDKKDIPKDVVSAIGHPDTAAVLTDILGFDIPFNRISVKLNPGDELYVAQIVGGRLPEGATTLPDGFDIVFIKLTI